MATDEEKTVIGLPLARGQAWDDRTVQAGRADTGRPRSGPRPDPAGRLGRRAAQTQEPATVVLSALAAPLALPAPAARSRDANPLLAAATPMLLLLGHLRSGRLDPRDAGLQGRLAAELSDMEHAARDAGADPDDLEDCVYVLAATADDVMRNLPGSHAAGRTDAGLVARRFGVDGAAGSAAGGAFHRIELALVHPASKARRLEVMLACLSLGLGGAAQNPADARELGRWRAVVARTLQQVAPAKAALSPCWRPVVPDASADRGLPVWVAAAVGSLAVVVLFLPLASDLSRASATAESRIAGMHRGFAPLTLVRAVPQDRTVAQPRTPQLERLADGLRGLDVVLDVRNDWVLLRLPRDFGFAPGADAPTEVASRIAPALARVLDGEDGPIRVVGHSDALPLSGRGPFRTNAQLSAARAQTVADLLAPHMADPSRLRAEGRGALDPIADNATPEGRASNRRVEILIRRAP